MCEIVLRNVNMKLIQFSTMQSLLQNECVSFDDEVCNYHKPTGCEYFLTALIRFSLSYSIQQPFGFYLSFSRRSFEPAQSDFLPINVVLNFVLQIFPFFFAIAILSRSYVRKRKSDNRIKQREAQNQIQEISLFSRRSIPTIHQLFIHTIIHWKWMFVQETFVVARHAGQIANSKYVTLWCIDAYLPKWHSVNANMKSISSNEFQSKFVGHAFYLATDTLYLLH